MINFDKLKLNNGDTVINPRDVFMTLPSKSQKYLYPWDVQSEVWRKWFEVRESSNCVIKMNTGSGKTIVGLMILKSCLNEGKGPAVYVVPDNPLVIQVFEEANALGISVTQDEKDYKFLKGEAILVINIYKLVNGKSVFGMRSRDNVNIGSIVVDDAHACVDIIQRQSTIKISKDMDVYKKILQIFSHSLSTQSYSSYQDIVEKGDRIALLMVPYWEWQKKYKDVLTLLNQSASEDIAFPLNFIKDILHLCRCLVSSSVIEISPICIPIQKITSYSNALRKIYMSATLPDDSVLSSVLGVDITKTKLIAPEYASDIGERLILFPQLMNRSLSDEDIKTMLKSLSTEHNIVIITPSERRSKHWDSISSGTYNSTNIHEGIALLKTEGHRIVTLINKYDGIDLPDDTCRILVIDGLPVIQTLFEQYIDNASQEHKQLSYQRLLKIEQGMGRGIRSSNDHCVVILVGKNLVYALHSSGNLDYFSEATRQQYDLSTQVWNQFDSPNIDTIKTIMDYCLKRDKSWVSVSREATASLKYPTNLNVNPLAIKQRQAFESALAGQYQHSVDILNEANEIIVSTETKAIVVQNIAEYMNLYDPIGAQKSQLFARQNNNMLLKPVDGINYQRLEYIKMQQASKLTTYIDKLKLDRNGYLCKVDSCLCDLVFAPDSYQRFESAMKEISFLIGITSTRPDHEDSVGPDNLWCLSENSYWVIECKNETITSYISKSDCEQLNESINWFNRQYNMGGFSNCNPTMIHQSGIFDDKCSPHPDVRIMTPDLLDKFKDNVKSFADAYSAAPIFRNIEEAQKLLDFFSLSAKIIARNYTKPYRINHR